MKNLYPFLLILLFLQSCSVYHSKSLSAEEAVAANNKVKVVTAQEQKLKFRKLTMENEQLSGLTKPGSATAKKLDGLPSQPQGRFVKIDISEVDIEKIKLRNNTLSTIINIATPLVVVFTGLVVLVATSLPYGY
ncbi:hypothetical protein ACXYMT_04330 [Salinimicrobium sp. CAU 1759]